MVLEVGALNPWNVEDCRPVALLGAGELWIVGNWHSTSVERDHLRRRGSLDLLLLFLEPLKIPAAQRIDDVAAAALLLAGELVKEGEHVTFELHAGCYAMDLFHPFIIP